MSFHTSCVCDTCEKHLQADNEDLALAEGWFILRFNSEEEEFTRDFCSKRCMQIWAGRKEEILVREED